MWPALGVGAVLAAAAASLIGLTALRVRVPRAQRARAEMLWNHLREDALDNGTTLRLQRNGLRVGVMLGLRQKVRRHQLYLRRRVCTRVQNGQPPE
jgi:hypothetical protein